MITTLNELYNNNSYYYNNIIIIITLSSSGELRIEFPRVFIEQCLIKHKNIFTFYQLVILLLLLLLLLLLS
jgi:hypothetical protein